MIQFRCTGCNASYTVGDDKAGKSGRCKTCQTPFTVPQPQAVSPPPPPAPEPIFDEPPTKKAVARRPAPEPEDDVDERPPKKAARREERDDEEDERPRRVAKKRESEEEDEPREPIKPKKPKTKLPPLMKALAMIRRGHFLDVVTFTLFLLVSAGLYFGVVFVTDGQVQEKVQLREAARFKFASSWGPGPNGQWR